jgi:hypothetical protein
MSSVKATTVMRPERDKAPSQDCTLARRLMTNMYTGMASQHANVSNKTNPIGNITRLQGLS